MKPKKLKRILVTSLESLFRDAIHSAWERGQHIDTIVLSEKSALPLDVPKATKRGIPVYESAFGYHRVKVDKRYRGDQILFYGVEKR